MSPISNPRSFMSLDVDTLRSRLVALPPDPFVMYFARYLPTSRISCARVMNTMRPPPTASHAWLIQFCGMNLSTSACRCGSPDSCSSRTQMYDGASSNLRLRYTLNLLHTFQMYSCGFRFSGIACGSSVSVRKRSSPFSIAALAMSLHLCHALSGPHTGQPHRLQYSRLYTYFSFPPSSATFLLIALCPHTLLRLCFFISSEESQESPPPIPHTPFLALPNTQTAARPSSPSARPAACS